MIQLHLSENHSCSNGYQMKKQTTLILAIILIAVITLTACGNDPTPAADNSVPSTLTADSVSNATSTPDLCAPENISVEIEQVHRLMREFDDAALLASKIPRDQLSPNIADLQRIRRAAEDQDIPSCIAALKQHQLAHMNTVINTMLYMLNYQGTDAETEVLNQGIALARQQHDQYTLEMATLLGLTVVAAPAAAPADETPPADAAPTPAP